MSLIILVSCPHGRQQALISFTFIYSSRAKNGQNEVFLIWLSAWGCYTYVLKILVFFSLKVLIQEVLIKKNNNNKKERMQLEEDQEEMMGNCFIL